jgi:Zn-dependent protease with chaperone function
MRRSLSLIIVTLNLYGCATPQMWLWEAEKISALPASTIQLRDKNGEIATTVTRSQISTLLGIKDKLERTASLSQVQLVIANPQEPNAFAWHDSNPKIGLTIGMLNLLGHDNDAYAAIIGHELAHLTLGHGAIRKEREDIAKGVNTVIGNIAGAFIPMGGLLTSLAVTAATTVYSRDEERDADRKGVEYMVAAGFDPQGAVRAWQKMSNASTGAPIPFLSTHPMSSERIENMQALVAARQTTQAFISDPRVRSPRREESIPAAFNPVASSPLSRLPLCPGSYGATWTNCVGTHTFTFGTKYTGEWKNGNHHGQGTTYGQDGSILQSGIWENGVFVNTFATPRRADVPTSPVGLTAAERMGGRAVAPSTEAPPATKVRPTDESQDRSAAYKRLKELDALRKEGILTQQEFDLKKAEILKEM